MAKTKSYSIEDLKVFVEKNGHMPRPQCRKDREEMLLGLWVFRTLQHGTVEQENKIRALAKGVPGPCPKSRTDRFADLQKFCLENGRFPASSREERSLYDFVMKNSDRLEFIELRKKYEKKRRG